MAAVDRHQAGLRRVAVGAKLATGRGWEGVRLVTAGAGLASRVGAIVRGGDGRVARRARTCFGRAIVAVRAMAIDTCLFAGMMNGTHLTVATATRARRLHGGMRCVAAGAVRVGLRDGAHERRLGTVAGGANARASGDEVVRLVAAQTAVVTGGLGPGGLRVTRRTAGNCRWRGRVRAMTVEAILTAGMSRMLGRTLFVAALAGGRLDGGCLVGVMAIVAGDRPVLNERRERPLRLAMAIDAPGRRARRKGVAREAIGLRGPAGVRVSRLFLVTTRANRHAGIFETRVGVMAVFASDGAAPHVMLMTPAGSILRPRVRHGHRNDRHRSSRENAEKSSYAGGREHEHTRQNGENRTPPAAGHIPPWQRRQGRSTSLSLVLEKPGPCGLPPGPPTRWQSTQSCSPAPPWQLAQDMGSRRACTPC